MQLCSKAHLFLRLVSETVISSQTWRFHLIPYLTPTLCTLTLLFLLPVTFRYFYNIFLMLTVRCFPYYKVSSNKGRDLYWVGQKVC